MNLLTRWIAIAPLAVLFAAQAFTDSDAELKEAAWQRAAPVAAKKAAPPVRTAWVPLTAKSLDGFKPVFPEDRAASRPATLAKADPPPAPAKR